MCELETQSERVNKFLMAKVAKVKVLDKSVIEEVNKRTIHTHHIRTDL